MSAIRKLIECAGVSYTILAEVADAAETELKELEGVAVGALWNASNAEHIKNLQALLQERDRADAELLEVIGRYECDPDDWEGEHVTADCLTCIAKGWAAAKGGGK